MQVTAGGGGGGGGGLARFRSAPATWLEALLEDDDSLKLASPHQGGLTQLLTAGTTTPAAAAAEGPSDRDSSAYIQPASDPSVFDGGGGVQSNAGFYRMNSSPADFLSGNVDGYFSSFGNLDFGGSSADVSSSGKRLRDFDSDHPSSNYANHRVN